MYKHEMIEMAGKCLGFNQALFMTTSSLNQFTHIITVGFLIFISGTKMKTTHDLLAFLEAHQIAFQSWEHPAVFTVEQVNELGIHMPGVHTKNLFLRDKRATRLFMLVAPGDKTIDLKKVAEIIGVNNLSFASTERLQNNLGIGAGSVSVLALINDEAGKVEVVFDREVWQSEAITAHPLVNTRTLVISQPDLKRFLEIIHHTPLVIDL